MYNLITFIKTETKFIINAFCVFFILLLLCYICSQNHEGYIAKKGNSDEAEIGVSSYTMRDELIINGKLQGLNNNAFNPE